MQSGSGKDARHHCIKGETAEVISDEIKCASFLFLTKLNEL